MSTLDVQQTKQDALLQRAYRAFFTPGRYEAKSGELEVVRSGTSSRVPSAAGELALTTWGVGPAVLLMHGWGGSRAQMSGFVQPLLDAGCRVVAYDQPAHGESDGATTNILQITPTLDPIAQREGPFEAVIAHSFGTLITSLALSRNLLAPPSRLVYLGAFNRLLDSIPRFLAQARLPESMTGPFLSRLYAEFGRDLMESIANERLVKGISARALLFHDASDNVTPVEDSRAVAAAWKTARLVETTGLGHRGGLQAPHVIAQAVQFLREQ